MHLSPSQLSPSLVVESGVVSQGFSVDPGSIVVLKGGSLRGGTLSGDVEIRGGNFVEVVTSHAGRLQVLGGVFANDLQGDNDTLVEVSGGELNGGLFALENSQFTVFGDSFNHPSGPISSTAGTLTGTLADGTPLNVSFGRASTATITLIDTSELDILRVDQTGTVIAYTSMGDFITNQNGMVLGPPVSDFATARGFFSVADKFYAILSDGMIIEYPTALDFGLDSNGTVTDTVPEYATDIGYLGAAPIPIFPAPALGHSGRAALTALLIGAAGFVFARRQRAGSAQSS